MHIYKFRDPDKVTQNGKVISANEFMSLFGTLIPNNSKISFSIGSKDPPPCFLTGISIGNNYAPGLFTMCSNCDTVGQLQDPVYNGTDIFHLVFNLALSDQLKQLPVIFYIESISTPKN